MSKLRCFYSSIRSDNKNARELENLITAATNRYDFFLVGYCVTDCACTRLGSQSGESIPTAFSHSLKRGAQVRDFYLFQKYQSVFISLISI